MKVYVNDPENSLTDEEGRLLKWSNPADDMTYAQIQRKGDGDFLLGYMIVIAEFLGKPKPFVRNVKRSNTK